MNPPEIHTIIDFYTWPFKILEIDVIINHRKIPGIKCQTDILINTQTLLPTNNSSLVPFLPAVPSEDAKIPVIIADRLMVGILLGVKENELV